MVIQQDAKVYSKVFIKGLPNKDGDDTAYTYCDICGEKMHTKCAHCGTLVIKTLVRPLPSNCHVCHKPFPWIVACSKNPQHSISRDKILNKNYQNPTEPTEVEFTLSPHLNPPLQEYESIQKKILRIASFLLLFCLLTIGLIYLFAKSSVNEQPSKTSPIPQSTAVTSTPFSSLPFSYQPQQASNGEVFVNPSYERVCPLKVSVRGFDAYFVRLVYISAPFYSHTERHPISSVSHQGDIAFYVSPGSTVDLDVPIGVYKLYYATGKTWYGQRLYFGDETRWFTSDDLLIFYTEINTVNGITLELFTQTGGNFETYDIKENDLPFD